MKDFIIVLPIHSNYYGVVKNFLQLFRKNWGECQIGVVISITGEDVKTNGVEKIYNGEDASLIDCLVNAAKQYKSRYYISFLGDAFISEKIDNDKVMKLLSDLAENDIEYCSLQCVKNYRKEKKFNEHFRHINNLDRYSHNFTAFVASREFVLKEMAKSKTDLDFEKRYLYQKDSFYYDRHLIVKKNYFNLLPSIAKGKWDRFNVAKLKKNNPEIGFENRELQIEKRRRFMSRAGDGSSLYTVVFAGWIEGVCREGFSDRIWSDRIGVRYGE